MPLVASRVEKLVWDEANEGVELRWYSRGKGDDDGAVAVDVVGGGGGGIKSENR